MSLKFDNDLIESVKKYPILYRTKAKNYKNIIKKGNCWIKIAAELNKTPEECKSKWRNIRDNYIKNKKKKNSGAPVSFSKYDDERLNFLSETFDEGESSNPESCSGATYVVCDVVKEEYDSSEDMPLAESPFILGDANSIVAAEQPSYTPAIITTAFDGTQQVLTPHQTLTVQESNATPPPKRPMKRKIDSIIDELRKDREERHLMIQQLVSRATAANQSPVHNFFASMADIVSNFPPEKVTEVRMRVCTLISDVELSVLRNK